MSLSYKINKVVITGVTGFIGAALAKELLKRGVIVYGIGRNFDDLDFIDSYKNFHKIVLEFDDYCNISKIIIDKNIDVFIHVAYAGVSGKSKQNYCVQISNLEVACTTVEQAVKMGCGRYLYVGSVDEYEIVRKPDELFIPPNHSRIYATIKYASEIIGKVIAYENNLEYVGALLALTYGEGNKSDILPNIIIRNSVNNQSTNLINGDNHYDMIYIDEAVNGIIAVAENGKSYESYYVGHETLKTFKELVEEISVFVGNKGPLKFGQYPDPPFAINYNEIDREKIYRDTGFRCMIDLQNAILKTKNWLAD